MQDIGIDDPAIERVDIDPHDGTRAVDAIHRVDVAAKSRLPDTFETVLFRQDVDDLAWRQWRAARRCKISRGIGITVGGALGIIVLAVIVLAVIVLAVIVLAIMILAIIGLGGSGQRHHDGTCGQGGNAAQDARANLIHEVC